MPHRSFGDILRDERELSGYDLASMSRRLHVRPDILAAIENGDFDRMPARGYAKNMIRAYARALNLNERQITELYLDEVNAYELGFLHGGSGRSRDRQPSRAFRDERGASQSLSRSRPMRSERLDREGGAPSRRTRFIDPALPPGRDRREDYDEHPASREFREALPARSRSRQGRGNPPSRGGSPSRNRKQGPRDNRQKGSMAAGIGSVLASFGGSPSRSEGRVGRSYDTVASTPPYARAGQAPRSGIAGMNLTMLLGIVAVLIIAIILVVVFVNGGKQATNEVPNIPISGLTDTSSPEDQDQVSGAETAPRNAKVTYSVPTGQSAWLEIYRGGSETPELAEVVDGPHSDDFEITDSIKIRTANPAGVTVTVNGEDVELEREGSSSNYSVTIDFVEILRQWYAARQTSSSSSSASATNTST